MVKQLRGCPAKKRAQPRPGRSLHRSQRYGRFVPALFAFQQPLQFLQRKVRRPAMRNDTLLTPGNFRRRLGNVARDFVGDDQHTVFVRVEEVARVDGCAAYFHGRTKINQMNAGVGNA